MQCGLLIGNAGDTRSHGLAERLHVGYVGMNLVVTLSQCRELLGHPAVAVLQGLM